MNFKQSLFHLLATNNDLQNNLIRLAVISFLVILLFSQQSFAINIDEAIDLGIKNSLEVKIETKKTEFTGLSKFEAATDFLPNVRYNYRDLTRRTQIASLQDKQRDKIKTFDVSENIFNGFSGVSKVMAAIYQGKSADQSLSLKKNEISLQVAESYLNIFRYRQIIAIDDALLQDYKRLVALATKRLSLKDISYGEFADYVLRANKVKVDANQNKIALNKYETNFTHLTNEKPQNLSYPKIEWKISGQYSNYNDLISAALNSNPKIKSSSFAYQAKKANVAAESGKLLPTVSLHLQYESDSSSYYFGGGATKNKSVYINFAVPIFQAGTEYSSILKANKERQIADLEKQLAVKEIEKGVMDEYQKYLALQESLKTAREALETSSKSLNLAKSRFDKKDIGLMDYLLQKINNTEAEKQMLAIKCDYAIGHYNLEFLINEIAH